jgi:Transposase DDE domain
MGRTPQTWRWPRQAQSWPACLRQFLTPAVWKQARRGRVGPRRPTRWDFHHLILVVLALTWSLGESTPERFEMARGIVALCRPKRRRAGPTAQGFQKALIRLPMRPLVALATGVRHRLLQLLGDDLLVQGFLPLGCDGSRLECPRNDEPLARMGQAGKADSTPALGITALVHLSTGVPWSWRLGKGTASERVPLWQLIGTLPKLALVIAAAGFHSDGLAAALLAANRSFLIRMSSKVRLFVDPALDRDRFDQALVTDWPREARRQQQPPLRPRLIRVRGRRVVQGTRRRVDVWLLTNVLDPKQLSVSQAALFYRLRWENEGLFRTYKRTLAKVHLVGRTVRAVHREAYGSLLSCQLLLAQGAWALRQRRGPTSAAVSPGSARPLLLVMRQELLAALKPDRRATYLERLGRCTRERRARTSGKQKRQWPRRTPHVPPKPPRLLTMNDKEKALFSRLGAAS